MNRGDLFVISAPSGAGKTTICRRLLSRVDGLRISVSYTTRPRKNGEETGKDYFFVSPEEFDNMAVSGGFLEHASVYGNRYGTARSVVDSVVAHGDDVLLEIDVQGGRSVKAAYPGAVLIGILPPDLHTLEGRLSGRGRDTEDEIKSRLSAAVGELVHLREYDFLVVNDDLESAVNRVQCVIQACRLRALRTVRKIDQLIEESER